MEKALGRFITFEGIEGVGKSTLIKFTQDYLSQAGISVITTREPGGTEIAEEIRKVLLTPHQEAITSQAELLLLFAGRAQHIAHVILPALEKDYWVLCDRFTDATYAYQGYGRGLPIEEIVKLEQWIQKELHPDLVLLFDAPVEIAMRRAKGRSAPDRIEIERESFFQKVRQGYLSRAKQLPERYAIINASVSLFEVKEQVKIILDQLLSNQK